MTAAMQAGQHQGVLTAALFKGPKPSTASDASTLDVGQALLRVGQSQQAELVARAHLEQQAESIDGLLLGARACLQSGPTSLFVGTASALDGLHFARQALRAAIKAKAGAEQIAKLQLATCKALRSSVASNPGLPPKQAAAYASESLSIAQHVAGKHSATADALYTLALLQAEARMLPQARLTARAALKACSASSSSTAASPSFPASPPSASEPTDSPGRALRLTGSSFEASRVKEPQQSSQTPIASHRVSRPSWDATADANGTSSARTTDAGDQRASITSSEAGTQQTTASPAANGSISDPRSGSAQADQKARISQTESAEFEPLAWALLALILSAEKQTELALQAVRQGAATAQPQHGGLLLRIEARLLQASGDVAGALKLLARVLQRAKAGQEAVGSCQDPKQSPEQHSAWDNQVMEAWLELARAYMEAGDTTSATQCHQEGYNLTPEGRAVLCMQAGLYQAAGNEVGAMTTLSKCLAAWPGHPRASTLMGALLLSRGGPHDLTLAEGYFRDALRHAPQNYRAWMGLGQVLTQRQQLEEAARCCQTAAELAAAEPVLPFGNMPCPIRE